MKQKIKNILNVAIPVAVAFFIGAIIIFTIGENPISVYAIMIKKSLLNFDGILKTLHFASPLLLTALAIGITFRANIFNMGVEGQMLLGAFFASVVGFSLNGINPILHVSLCMLTGMVVGALFAFIPAILKAYFKINELVVTLMLNYIALEIVKFLSQSVFRDPAAGYVATYMINDSAMLKKIIGNDITLFVFIAAIVFVLVYILVKKSRLGYEAEAIGKNTEFAEASGMEVYKKIIVIMLISGGISGLAGAGFLMSEKYRFTLDFSGNPGLGWDGMLISLMGSHSPIGTAVASFFYASLKTGNEYIGFFTEVPKDIVGIIQGILIIIISVKMFNENRKARKLKKHIIKIAKEATQNEYSK